MKKNIARACFGIGLASLMTYGLSAQAESWIKIPTWDKVVPDQLNPTLHKLFPGWSEKNLSAKDEAKRAEEAGNLSEAQKQMMFKGAADDYFKDMDYGITKDPAQVKKVLETWVPGISEKEAVERMARGRNNWIVWTFGNDQFWNGLGHATFGSLDFLKTVSSHPNLPSVRSNRWKTLGLVNEPCYVQATEADENRWGLWLDKRDPKLPGCSEPDPFEAESNYPGVKIGSRGTTFKYKGKDIKFPVGSIYGYATGVVGLRLFPNPDFDEKAAKKWDPKKYYEDPVYFNDPKLIRPFRVGMSCAFCHVGPNPSNPPADFNNPTWANLNSNPGAQYFWFDRIFMWNWKKTKEAKYPSQEDNFVFQFAHSFRPGALDTSLVSSDQINNARTMNAIYDLPARLNAAIKFNSTEVLTGEETRTMQFRKFKSSELPQNSSLRTISRDQNGSELAVAPRILKDGADSVGALGALNRVYVNIGLFGEEWTKHFIPLIGGPTLTPFPVRIAEENSIYWQANVRQTPDLALFFMASARPDKLNVAPGGNSYLKEMNSPEVTMGKRVFAETCAACHSSKVPDKGYAFFNQKNPAACHGKNYMQCWESYWNYTKTDEFKADMRKLVEQEDFLKDNFLSTDLRIPVNLTDSQLCSPIATNGLKGDIWDNFTSSTYKGLPSIGTFKVNYPVDDGTTLASEDIQVPDGGRGFLRPPSLISLWSTAPFLQNNTLGLFDDRGTVEGRMLSFDDSIKKLLNPELRANPDGPSLRGSDTKAVFYITNRGDRLPGDIDVTNQVSYLKIPYGYLPKYIEEIIKVRMKLLSKADQKLLEKKGPEYITFPGEKENVVAVKGKESKEKRVIASAYDDYAATTDPKKMGNDLLLGPIPAGVPVNLIVNLDLSPKNGLRLTPALYSLIDGIFAAKGKPEAVALRLFMEKAAENLIKASKCSDFVVNRGHYFGTQYDPRVKEGKANALTSEEKTALVEYLKHF